MATLEDAINSGQLELFQIPDDVERLALRPLYVSRILIDWVDGTLVYHAAKVAGRYAHEHLEQFLIDFRCNEKIHHSDLKRMIPTGKGVWKMHPPMLRVFGWCPKPHCFVAVLGQLGDDTKEDSSLNDQCRDEVLNFIAKNGLNAEVEYGDFLDVFQS